MKKSEFSEHQIINIYRFARNKKAPDIPPAKQDILKVENSGNYTLI